MDLGSQNGRSMILEDRLEEDSEGTKSKSEKSWQQPLMILFFVHWPGSEIYNEEEYTASKHWDVLQKVRYVTWNLLSTCSWFGCTVKAYHDASRCSQTQSSCVNLQDSTTFTRVDHGLTSKYFSNISGRPFYTFGYLTCLHTIISSTILAATLWHIATRNLQKVWRD